MYHYLYNIYIFFIHSFFFFLLYICKNQQQRCKKNFFLFFFFWSSIVTRCKTYRESRYRTAGRGEGVTSRCQTVPWLRDVPKGAHNWFQISQSTVLLISVNGNSGNLSFPYECPTFAKYKKIQEKRTHILCIK